MNTIEGTIKRDKLTGTELNDRFVISEGKDKIRNFDLENDTLVLDYGVDYDLKVRGNNVIVYGDGFKTVIKGVDCIDSLMIEENLDAYLTQTDGRLPFILINDFLG